MYIQCTLLTFQFEVLNNIVQNVINYTLLLNKACFAHNLELPTFYKGMVKDVSARSKATYKLGCKVHSRLWGSDTDLGSLLLALPR